MNCEHFQPQTSHAGYASVTLHACPWCQIKQIDRLRDELTAARLNNQCLNVHCADLSRQHHEALEEIDRLVLRCAAMAALLYPRVLREAVAGGVYLQTSVAA